MKFSQLVEYFEKIENTTSRLTITEVLADLFSHLSPQETQETVYLLQGRVAPAFEAVEFGMAEKMIIKSVLLALQLDLTDFKKEFQKVGDVGKTIFHFKKQIQSLEERDLTISEVYQELCQITTASGPGSQETKISTLAHLVRTCDPLSAYYLVRIPQAVMRLGFSDMTVLDAFSWMLKKDKSLRPIIEGAYHVRPDLGYIGKTLKESGIEAVKKIQPSLFTPIIMMRAERLPSAKDIVEKIGKCIIEPKFDGFRLQIHYSKKKNRVKLFSRSLEDVTYMYPDLVEGIKNEVKVDEIILEGEALGFDPHSNTFLPFQETVQRKRKYDISEKAKEIPLKLFAFELLFLNKKSYIFEPLSKRRETLESVIDQQQKDVFSRTILLAEKHISDDPKQIELIFDESISEGLEGIVCKKMSGVYQPGARGYNWIKFKKSYSTTINDTIDCLIMGYDYGKGKRASFGIGAFLAGVYNEKEDKFMTVAKIGTGLSDEEWKELKKRCDKYVDDNKPALYEVDKAMYVDVWVKPAIVAEIKADEITRSPVHTAGRVMKSSKSGKGFMVDVAGFALRFPRLQRFRDDKRPEDVTTLKELEEIHNAAKNHNT